MINVTTSQVLRTTTSMKKSLIVQALGFWGRLNAKGSLNCCHRATRTRHPCHSSAFPYDESHAHYWQDMSKIRWPAPMLCRTMCWRGEETIRHGGEQRGVGGRWWVSALHENKNTDTGDHFGRGFKSNAPFVNTCKCCFAKCTRRSLSYQCKQ